MQLEWNLPQAAQQLPDNQEHSAEKSWHRHEVGLIQRWECALFRQENSAFINRRTENIFNIEFLFSSRSTLQKLKHQQKINHKELTMPNLYFFKHQVVPYTVSSDNIPKDSD